MAATVLEFATSSWQSWMNSQITHWNAVQFPKKFYNFLRIYQHICRFGVMTTHYTKLQIRTSLTYFLSSFHRGVSHDIGVRKKKKNVTVKIIIWSYVPLSNRIPRSNFENNRYRLRQYFCIPRSARNSGGIVSVIRILFVIGFSSIAALVSIIFGAPPNFFFLRFFRRVFFGLSTTLSESFEGVSKSASLSDFFDVHWKKK